MKRVEFVPGETKPVEITIPVEELRFCDRGEWVLDAEYTVYVGTNCANATHCAKTICMESGQMTRCMIKWREKIKLSADLRFKNYLGATLMPSV